MKIKIKFHSFSDASFHPTHIFEVEDELWNEDIFDRDYEVDEEAEGFIRDDIDWEYEEINE